MIHERYQGLSDKIAKIDGELIAQYKADHGVAEIFETENFYVFNVRIYVSLLYFKVDFAKIPKPLSKEVLGDKIKEFFGFRWAVSKLLEDLNIQEVEYIK